MAKVKTATRTIRNAAPSRSLALVTSPKAIGDLPTESLVELDGLIELTSDRDIVSVKVQPETFELEVDGKEVKYTPDVEFVRRDGRIGFREFKDSSKPLPPEMQRKLQVASEFFAQRGYEFIVRTSDELREGYRIANLKHLKRYARWKTSEAFQRAVLEFVGGREDLYLNDLRERVGPAAYGAMYRMLCDGQLEADLQAAPLSGSTRVWRSQP